MSRERIGYTSPHHEGAWSSANNYTPLSVVTNNGSSYIAKKAVPAGTALNNSVYWGLLASVGADPNISITKTGTVGLVDTYTWTDSTSGNTGTFTVTNGQDGEITGDVIATPYDNTAAYKVGNLLTYLGKQYYCIADAPAGTLPTNTTYFEEKSVADIIEMIKNGSIVVGHSDVADNLTPYSEDSGTTQENPFISQGTGTDNNSVIVTTGTIARQLEKQGNTVPVMQLVQDANKSKTLPAETNKLENIQSFNVPANHTLFIMWKQNTTLTSTLRNTPYLNYSDNTTQYMSTTENLHLSAGWYTWIVTTTKEATALRYWSHTPNTDLSISDISCFDITAWKDSVKTDLLANPSHFSWYYNGSMSYDSGSLQNCNGRYLECGQGRNLFDQEWEQGAYNTDTGAKESSTFKIRSKNRYLVTPLLSYYFWQNTVNTGTFRVFQYDKDGNYLGNIAITARGTFTVVANCRWITFQCADSYGTTYNNDISIELYYTPEQGGEGYGDMHDYIAPIRIDTGNETLKAFDKKLPSGVIERNTGEVDLGDLTWAYTEPSTGYPYGRFAATVAGKAHGTKNILCAKYVTVNRETSLYSDDKSIVGRADTSTVYVIDSAYTDVATFKTAMSGVMLQYELETPTTEQGTPFSEYAPINDYSYMAWFDTDGNLVSIPQGCKLFYPVDYKGFTDDLVMYTNGDATALAKEEDITDTALNARGYYKMQDLLTMFGAGGMVGGTLRQTLANANNLDFRKTACVKMADMPWLYHENGYFYSILQDRKAGSLTMLCTNYGTGSGTGVASITDGQITSGTGNTNIFVIDTSCNGNVDTFIEKNKYQLFAYELAD